MSYPQYGNASDDASLVRIGRLERENGYLREKIASQDERHLADLSISRQLAAATERATKAEAELATERGRLDWLEKIGFSTTNSSSEYAPGVHCWRDKDGWGWTAHWISSECKTARAAIDAAIAQAGSARCTDCGLLIGVNHGRARCLCLSVTDYAPTSGAEAQPNGLASDTFASGTDWRGNE